MKDKEWMQLLQAKANQRKWLQTGCNVGSKVQHIKWKHLMRKELRSVDSERGRNCDVQGPRQGCSSTEGQKKNLDEYKICAGIRGSTQQRHQLPAAPAAWCVHLGPTPQSLLYPELVPSTWANESKSRRRKTRKTRRGDSSQRPWLQAVSSHIGRLSAVSHFPCSSPTTGPSTLPGSAMSFQVTLLPIYSKPLSDVFPTVSLIKTGRSNQDKLPNTCSTHSSSTPFINVTAMFWMP